MLEDYTVFESKQEVAKANGRWLYQLYKDGEILKDRHLRKNPKESVFFDVGEELEDGRFACKIPTKHSDKFGGKKEKLARIKFKKVKI